MLLEGRDGGDYLLVLERCLQGLRALREHGRRVLRSWVCQDFARRMRNGGGLIETTPLQRQT
jgi:hypothetical protein